MENPLLKENLIKGLKEALKNKEGMDSCDLYSVYRKHCLIPYEDLCYTTEKAFSELKSTPEVDAMKYNLLKLLPVYVIEFHIKVFEQISFETLHQIIPLDNPLRLVEDLQREKQINVLIDEKEKLLVKKPEKPLKERINKILLLEKDFLK